MAQYIEHNPSVQDDFKSWLKSWRLELERADTNTNADNTKEGHAMIPTGDIPDQHFDNGDDVDKDGVSIPNNNSLNSNESKEISNSINNYC